jgi:excisionase family DNA binding protein
MGAKKNAPLIDNQIERLLTAKEIAQVLGFKLVTIRKWTYLGQIPYIKFDRGVRYRLSEINHWLKSKQQGIGPF